MQNEQEQFGKELTGQKVSEERRKMTVLILNPKNCGMADST